MTNNGKFEYVDVAESESTPHGDVVPIPTLAAPAANIERLSVVVDHLDGIAPPVV